MQCFFIEQSFSIISAICNQQPDFEDGKCYYLGYEWGSFTIYISRGKFRNQIWARACFCEFTYNLFYIYLKIEIGIGILYIMKLRLGFAKRNVNKLSKANIKSFFQKLQMQKVSISLNHQILYIVRTIRHSIVLVYRSTCTRIDNKHWMEESTIGA